MTAPDDADRAAVARLADHMADLYRRERVNNLRWYGRAETDKERRDRMTAEQAEVDREVGRMAVRDHGYRTHDDPDLAMKIAAESRDLNGEFA